VEGEIGVIGITDFAQQELGDIVYVELPARGATLTSGKEMGSVESVKAVSEIFAPVSGRVEEVNAGLATAPEMVNREPYGGGWMVKVRLADPAAAASLMDLSAYQEYLKAEAAKK
jgi:glycine cleavage system H protein